MQKQFGYKKFGLVHLNQSTDILHYQILQLNQFIKIIFVKNSAKFELDFQQYNLKNPSLIFIKHTHNLINFISDDAQMIFYNRDFYCVEIHDKEVSCDGILLNNIYEMPIISLNSNQNILVESLIQDVENELKNKDWANEEMLRVLLKQLIIRSTRFWKESYQFELPTQTQDVEFIRKFSSLVENNFRHLHTVSDYATILHVTPKLLNKKITSIMNQSPNDFIKQRIVLEAKKLLAHSQLSVKEISYELGYEDPAYFVRLFRKYTQTSPNVFRKEYSTNR